jgi:hypothetical protein
MYKVEFDGYYRNYIYLTLPSLTIWSFYVPYLKASVLRVQDEVTKEYRYRLSYLGTGTVVLLIKWGHDAKDS